MVLQYLLVPPRSCRLLQRPLAYCINPELINDKTYMLTVITVFFWASTLLNFFGMRASNLLSIVSALIGTLFPMGLIIFLGIHWLAVGKPSQVAFTWHSFFPDLTQCNNLVLVVGLMFGLVGMEMSASHAAEVRNPQRDYPKAIFWSAIIILATLIGASLAIAIVVPVQDLNIISGLLQAFDAFFKAFHMSWFTPILAFLIISRRHRWRECVDSRSEQRVVGREP